MRCAPLALVALFGAASASAEQQQVAVSAGHLRRFSAAGKKNNPTAPSLAARQHQLSRALQDVDDEHAHEDGEEHHEDEGEDEDGEEHHEEGEMEKLPGWMTEEGHEEGEHHDDEHGEEDEDHPETAVVEEEEHHDEEEEHHDEDEDEEGKYRNLDLA